jgi:uncharacterized protein (DUF488 family)
MSDNINPVFTIGHSNHSPEGFVVLLKRHGITAVADVRSVPYSRFNPQFNREILEQFLKGNGIYYIFLGQELGARTEDRSCYEKGRVLYARVARTQSFQRGLERVREGSGKHRIALMCSEKEPLECHRTLLVAKELVLSARQVQHIHADGTLEAHEAAMERLFDLTGVVKQDLFCSYQELLDQALAKQERQIAYVEEEATP